MSSHPHTNRLIDETSPYLKQHAHNPVDWYPWGEEALRAAKEQDKPIFLSIGYSACHWCHVMERESFEDEETGQLLNKHFISIKVDREERPDLDQIYMTAVQLMTRQGGWPMSMFLTPELKPFFGGTYFPPTDQYGRPSFKRVLMSIVQWWNEKRDAVNEQSETLTEHIQSVVDSRMEKKTLSVDLLRNAVAQLSSVFDSVYGGFGSAPKFPHSMDLSLLLRAWNRFGDQSALDMATKTLDMMARGGMFDHLGGGFHRYSTDARWLAPHFEKMLYDNALLAQTYLEGYQATGNAFYRQVVDDILTYVQREMSSPDGAFYSTQDADSEGVEGKFFVWSPGEINSILGEEAGKFFASVYDVTEAGNWEETNILHRARDDEQEAKVQGIDVGALQERLAAMRSKLLEHRNGRVWPARDDKMLTSWNGLMIAAFARAGQVLGNNEYVASAVNAADYIWRTMRTGDGRLLHTVFPGSPPKLNGYLEDYAYLLDGLTAVYEATFDPRWMQATHELAGVMIDEFWDDENGGFFDTGKQHEKLIARTKDPHDGATPSGNAMAVTALSRLIKWTGNNDWQSVVGKSLERFSGVMTDAPRAASQMLAALDFQIGPVQEFVVVADSDSDEFNQAVRLIHNGYRPNKVVAGLPPGTDVDECTKWVPLLDGKTASGTVTTYICEDFACQEPVVGLEELPDALRQ